MMRCSKARELISDALDARLDESRGIDLTRHLEGCADCHQHQLVLERGQALLREGLVSPSDNFEWKVQLKIQQALRENAAVKEPVSGWNFWRPALGSALGVALIVVVAGGLFLTPDTTLRVADTPQPAVALSVAESVPAEPIPAEPDLSGAVRGRRLQIDNTGGGFGIRTVADEAFVGSSPLRDPVGVARWRQEGVGEAIEVRRIISKDGRAQYVVYRRVHWSGGSLNLGGHRSRLREIHPAPEEQSTPDHPDS